MIAYRISFSRTNVIETKLQLTTVANNFLIITATAVGRFRDFSAQTKTAHYPT